MTTATRAGDRRALARPAPLGLLALATLVAACGDDARPAATADTATTAPDATLVEDVATTPDATLAEDVATTPDATLAEDVATTPDVADATTAPDAGDAFVPAAHTPFPLVSAPSSARVLAHPTFVTVTFADTDHVADVTAFGDAVATSRWWPAQTEEFGVGRATHAGAFVLSGDAPTTDAALRSRLAAAIADHTLPSAAAGAEPFLYVVYPPAADLLALSDDQGGGALCDGGTWGYHDSMGSESAPIPYALVGDCTGRLDDVTATASHELVEAATDPFFDAWFLDVGSDDPWWSVAGLEVSDLCEEEEYFVDGGFAIQRSWSNAAAEAGASPCVPIPEDEVFYMVSATPSDVPVVPRGRSATFTLVGWATAPDYPWQLDPYEDGYADFETTPDLDTTRMEDGGIAHLTLHVPSDAPHGGFGWVLVYSGTRTTDLRYWPVMIEAE